MTYDEMNERSELLEAEVDASAFVPPDETEVLEIMIDALKPLTADDILEPEFNEDEGDDLGFW
jgi:hypothetical protein